MLKPRALDLFCCAGGATRGLQLAGFHVTGVDIERQPHYVGDEFYQADALEFPLDGFDFIWASPPCQAHTLLRHVTKRSYPDLIPATRARLLAAAGTPFCIENVEFAPLTGNLLLLCGTMFGLQTPDGRAELRRHRVFETSFSIPLRPRCQHGFAGCMSVVGEGSPRSGRRSFTVTGHTAVDNKRPSITVTGSGMGARLARRRAISITGGTPQTNTERNFRRETFTVEEARTAMGIDWMPMRKLSQAIPPAYAEFVGRQAMALLRPKVPHLPETYPIGGGIEDGAR